MHSFRRGVDIDVWGGGTDDELLQAHGPQKIDAISTSTSPDLDGAHIDCGMTLPCHGVLASGDVADRMIWPKSYGWDDAGCYCSIFMNSFYTVRFHDEWLIA